MIKKLTLSTLAACAAVPAMLMLGTGTAQAATAWAWPDSDPLGVTMHVQSTGAWGWCEYTAVPVGGVSSLCRRTRSRSIWSMVKRARCGSPASRQARHGMSRSRANTAA
jgi:hypothetical protein